MPLSLYEMTVPLLTNMLTDMRGWLDRDDVQAQAAALFEARLIGDMRPLPAQYQMASDSAKNGVARLTGSEMPAMPDTEATLADLQARCDKTIAFLAGFTPAQFAGAETREVVMKFPGGHGYRFAGLAYLTGFMLPNFFFHVTTAYAILRAQGIALGKPDYLAHIGPPSILPEG